MKLEGVKGRDFRPTTQMVKGAILDSLYGEVQGGSFLDLFAGSGGVGIEALSRGAESAVFVEKRGNAAGIIKSNIERCGTGPENIRIVKGDAVDFLKNSAESREEFTVIFADPPYSAGLDEKIMGIICSLNYRICRILIIESSRELEIPPGVSGVRQRIRNYGQTYVNYFRF